MGNKLTDREIWANYWKNYQFAPLSKKQVYQKYLPIESESASFIEIGGFPGLNAAYFYKHVCKDVTLLDFYVDREIISKIESQNDIPPYTIKSIESDFFAFESMITYDIVFSLGFIEHFENTKDIIERHVRLLSDNGLLLILLPNLRGLNGLIQYLFDPKNLHIHNLKSMDIKLLRKISGELGLKDIKVEYTRKPMVWLEPKPTTANKVGRILTKCLSYFIKLFPIKSRLLSPYIVISAKK